MMVEMMPTVIETILIGWKIVRETLSSFSSYLRLLLHSDILLNSDPDIVDVIHEICNEVMVLGERRCGLVNVLVGHICHVWWNEWCEKDKRLRIIQSLLRHKTLILDFCLFGSVSRRSMRYL